MAVGDVYRCNVLQNVGSELTMNVLHVREVVAETVALFLAEPVAQFVHQIYLALADNMSEDWRVVQIEVYRVQPAPSNPYTWVLGAADEIVGVEVGQIIPSASAMVVSLYTNTETRRGQGRMYIPGLPESAQNEGQLTEAAHTNFDTWADTWLVDQSTPIAPNTGEYRVYVKSSFQLVGDPDFDVLGTTVRSNLGTMRSRRAHPGFGS